MTVVASDSHWLVMFTVTI